MRNSRQKEGEFTHAGNDKYYSRAEPEIGLMSNVLDLWSNRTLIDDERMCKSERPVEKVVKFLQGSHSSASGTGI